LYVYIGYIGETRPEYVFYQLTINGTNAVDDNTQPFLSGNGIMEIGLKQSASLTANQYYPLVGEFKKVELTNGQKRYYDNLILDILIRLQGGNSDSISEDNSDSISEDNSDSISEDNSDSISEDNSDSIINFNNLIKILKDRYLHYFLKKNDTDIFILVINCNQRYIQYCTSEDKFAEVLDMSISDFKGDHYEKIYYHDLPEKIKEILPNDLKKISVKSSEVEETMGAELPATVTKTNSNIFYILIDKIIKCMEYIYDVWLKYNNHTEVYESDEGLWFNFMNQAILIIMNIGKISMNIGHVNPSGYDIRYLNEIKYGISSMIMYFCTVVSAIHNPEHNIGLDSSPKYPYFIEDNDVLTYLCDLYNYCFISLIIENTDIFKIKEILESLTKPDDVKVYNLHKLQYIFKYICTRFIISICIADILKENHNNNDMINIKKVLDELKRLLELAEPVDASDIYMKLSSEFNFLEIFGFVNDICNKIYNKYIDTPRVDGILGSTKPLSDLASGPLGSIKTPPEYTPIPDNDGLQLLVTMSKDQIGKMFRSETLTDENLILKIFKGDVLIPNNAQDIMLDMNGGKLVLRDSSAALKTFMDVLIGKEAMELIRTTNQVSRTISIPKPSETIPTPKPSSTFSNVVNLIKRTINADKYKSDIFEAILVQKIRDIINNRLTPSDKIVFLVAYLYERLYLQNRIIQRIEKLMHDRSPDVFKIKPPLRERKLATSLLTDHTAPNVFISQIEKYKNLVNQIHKQPNDSDKQLVLELLNLWKEMVISISSENISTKNISWFYKNDIITIEEFFELQEAKYKKKAKDLVFKILYIINNINLPIKRVRNFIKLLIFIATEYYKNPNYDYKTIVDIPEYSLIIDEVVAIETEIISSKEKSVLSDGRDDASTHIISEPSSAASRVAQTASGSTVVSNGLDDAAKYSKSKPSSAAGGPRDMFSRLLGNKTADVSSVVSNGPDDAEKGSVLGLGSGASRVAQTASGSTVVSNGPDDAEKGSVLEPSSAAVGHRTDMFSQLWGNKTASRSTVVSNGRDDAEKGSKSKPSSAAGGPRIGMFSRLLNNKPAGGSVTSSVNLDGFASLDDVEMQKLFPDKDMGSGSLSTLRGHLPSGSNNHKGGKGNNASDYRLSKRYYTKDTKKRYGNQIKNKTLKLFNI